MKNRLKDVFSHDEPSKFMNTLKFLNQEKYIQFLEKLDLLYESGEKQDISGIESILTEQEINGRSFPHSKHGNITHAVIYPSEEPLSIQVETEYGEYHWEFKRVRTKTGATISAVGFGFVKIVVKLDQDAQKVTLNYTITPKDASTMHELGKAYSATISLLRKFIRLDTDQIDETFKTSIKHLQAMTSYYKMIIELEEKLNKKFDPKSINEDETEAESVYELYMMLVKCVPLRERYNKIGFSIDYSGNERPNNLTVGSFLMLTFVTSKSYVLFGESVFVYLFCIAFNLTLESVLDDKENQKYIVKMKDSDSAPGYISVKVFLDEAQRVREEEHLSSSFTEAIDEYKNAKTWVELVRQEFDL